MLANQTCSLIEHGRITTTLAKAKAVRPLAEKMVTLAKRGDLHARRRALALLHNNSTRTVKAVGKLFAEIAPRSAARNGGYTRVVKLGPRSSDSAPMAFIEWVDLIRGRAITRRRRYQELQEGGQVFRNRRPKISEEINSRNTYRTGRTRRSVLFVFIGDNHGSQHRRVATVSSRSRGLRRWGHRRYIESSNLWKFREML